MERRHSLLHKKPPPAWEKPQKPEEADDDGDGDSSGEGEDEKRLKLNLPPKLPNCPAPRRAGWAGGGSHPCCVVERCTADLGEAKRYYRRHKVCEAHSKAPVVLIAGLRQRFCQQCSRFHELSEFDDVKRSCRRRLVGHNERRRKNACESQGEGSNHLRVAEKVDPRATSNLG